MLIVRDLIRVLRFPLQEVSDWISLARPSHLDYGAVAEVSLYLAGGFLRGLPLLYSPECVEEKFCELRIDGVLRNSAIIRNQDVGKGPSRVQPFCVLRLGVYF
jgi:hypothetical protein